MREKAIHLHEQNNILSKDNEIGKHAIGGFLELLGVEMNCNQLVTILEDTDFVVGMVDGKLLVGIENDLG